MRLRFPDSPTDLDSPADLECPHCHGGAVTVTADGFVWTHGCGAYGYYDDGEHLFPHAQYRVIARVEEEGKGNST